MGGFGTDMEITPTHNIKGKIEIKHKQKGGGSFAGPFLESYAGTIPLVAAWRDLMLHFSQST